MKTTIERIVVHPTAVMAMSGISERSASRLLCRIRKFYGRSPRSLVSIEDFCGYTKFKEQYVRSFLK